MPPHSGLIFFVTEDWYFCSHRLPLGVAAREAGYEVSVITRVRSHGERIKAAGLRLIPLEISRRSVNPLREAGLVRRLVSIYRAERPRNPGVGAPFRPAYRFRKSATIAFSQRCRPRDQHPPSGDASDGCQHVGDPHPRSTPS